LSLPISVEVPIEKEAASRTGKIRDISRRAVYFTIYTDLSAGAEVDLTMILPAEVPSGTDVFIRATGKVFGWTNALGLASGSASLPYLRCMKSSATKPPSRNEMLVKRPSSSLCLPLIKWASTPGGHIIPFGAGGRDSCNA
jgi:hypothetical protein